MFRVVTVLTAVTIAVVPTLSRAEIRCADRTRVVERLEANYGEALSGGGLYSGQGIFEVWSSEESGTWTILMTRPDGTTCVMASGTDWRSESWLPTREGTPS